MTTESTDLRALLTKKPGDVIRSEDWNRIVSELISLREYIDNMSKSITLTGLVSRVGRGFDLNASDYPGLTYGTNAIGLISRQWLAQSDNPKIVCEFGLTDFFETMQFWAGADNGDRPTLDVMLGYIDGSEFKAGDRLFINSRATLTAKNQPSNNNPYLEFLQAPLGVWYKYEVKNKFPKKEVVYVRFINTSADCTPRIGNVLHLRSKLQSMG